MPTLKVSAAAAPVILRFRALRSSFVDSEPFQSLHADQFHRGHAHTGARPRQRAGSEFRSQIRTKRVSTPLLPALQPLICVEWLEFAGGKGDFGTVLLNYASHFFDVSS
jgi:hypothetical protein